MLLAFSKFSFDDKLTIMAQIDFWGFWTIGFCDPSLNVVGIEKWQTNFWIYGWCYKCGLNFHV
jgi:hypothetical protein